ncbi:hypothetical protein ACJJIW_10325 [Microbulbifer sp. JMSA004]|uniref:hypothetical protein n=1 Tax=unclassified Microbulbifer TaxID=2619833 RepID=UPI0024AC844D|nr:hypothetical protein [Microbulbifer sp. VAAF005]WHI45671.1 hypothetical protein P0078_18360 [Microbulbifer sp. VAAF005]
MRMAALAKLCGFALMCLGCSSQQSVETATPALLLETSPEIQSKLQTAVSQALGGAKVTLGPKVFVDDTVLVLENTPKQMALIGRDMGRPIKFQLVGNGEKCWLTRLSTGESWELPVLCKPVSTG